MDILSLDATDSSKKFVKLPESATAPIKITEVRISESK